MAFRIVSHNHNARQATVIVEADGQEEVTSLPARQAALDQASQLITRPGHDGTATPYPVDENGNTSDDLLFGRAGKVAGYRADFKFNSGL